MSSCFTPCDFGGEDTTNNKRSKEIFISLSFLYHFLQASIPFLPEFANHRLAEELPQRDAVTFALAFGGHAHTPFVVEDVGETVFFHQTDRVEVARNRLPEVAFAFQIGFFDGAEGRAVLVEVNESAFLAVHQGRDKLARLVVIVNIVVFYDFDAFGAHIGLDVFEVVFNLLYFRGFERCAGIASHTAPAFAARQAATELGVQEFVGDDDVVEDNHAAKIVV